MTCVKCNRQIRGDFDTKAIKGPGGWMHHRCFVKSDGQTELIDALMAKQDDHTIDPTTAMADLIGNLGHYCEAYNRAHPKRKIDFEDAMRRGLGYWRDER